MTIGERIKQRRLELHMSVDEVAAKLGKNRATVYRYESNDIENLPTAVLVPLAKVLETTPSALMGWSDKKIEKTDLSKTEADLLYVYRSLSDMGKKKVCKYADGVYALEHQEQELFAAHHREGVTQVSDHDRAIMEDDSKWEE